MRVIWRIYRDNGKEVEASIVYRDCIGLILESQSCPRYSDECSESTVANIAPSLFRLLARQRFTTSVSPQLLIFSYD